MVGGGGDSAYQCMFDIHRHIWPIISCASIEVMQVHPFINNMTIAIIIQMLLSRCWHVLFWSLCWITPPPPHHNNPSLSHHHAILQHHNNPSLCQPYNPSLSHHHAILQHHNNPSLSLHHAILQHHNNPSLSLHHDILQHHNNPSLSPPSC